jgi:hypothetical protein
MWNALTYMTDGPMNSMKVEVVPVNAVNRGFDNEQLYVGWTSYEGALIPGKTVPSHGVCYIAWEGGIPS